MTACVYLVAHGIKPIIKVGMASNAMNRIRQLGAKALDLRGSMILRVESSEVAATLEKAIHRRLAEWRLTAAEYSEIVGRPARSQEGPTEWFRDSCIKPMEQFLEQAQEQFGFEVERIELSQSGRVLRADVPLSLRVSDDLYRRLRLMAAHIRSTNIDIGAEALDAYLQAHGY